MGRWSEGWKEEVEKGGLAGLEGGGVREEVVEECRIAHGLLPPERERETDRQTDRDRERQRDMERDKERDTQTQRDRQMDR